MKLRTRSGSQLTWRELDENFLDLLASSHLPAQGIVNEIPAPGQGFGIKWLINTPTPQIIVSDGAEWFVRDMHDGEQILLINHAELGSYSTLRYQDGSLKPVGDQGTTAEVIEGLTGNLIITFDSPNQIHIKDVVASNLQIILDTGEHDKDTIKTVSIDKSSTYGIQVNNDGVLTNVGKDQAAIMSYSKTDDAWTVFVVPSSTVIATLSARVSALETGKVDKYIGYENFISKLDVNGNIVKTEWQEQVEQATNWKRSSLGDLDNSFGGRRGIYKSTNSGTTWSSSDMVMFDECDGDGENQLRSYFSTNSGNKYYQTAISAGGNEVLSGYRTYNQLQDLWGGGIDLYNGGGSNVLSSYRDDNGQGYLNMYDWEGWDLLYVGGDRVRRFRNPDGDDVIVFDGNSLILANNVGNTALEITEGYNVFRTPQGNEALYVEDFWVALRCDGDDVLTISKDQGGDNQHNELRLSRIYNDVLFQNISQTILYDTDGSEWFIDNRAAGVRVLRNQEGIPKISFADDLKFEDISVLEDVDEATAMYIKVATGELLEVLRKDIYKLLIIQEETESTYDLEVLTEVGRYDFSAYEVNPSALSFSADGLKMYLTGSSKVGTGQAGIHQFTLGTAFTPTSVSNYDGWVLYTPHAGVWVTRALRVSPDGTKMFIIDVEVAEYTLAQPNDVLTASFVRVSTQLSALTGAAGKDTLQIKDDGTALYVNNTTTDTIYRVSMNNVWQVDSLSVAGTFYYGAIVATIGTFYIADNGSKLLLFTTSGTDRFIMLPAITPWESWTSTGSTSKAWASGVSQMTVSPDGKKILSRVSATQVIEVSISQVIIVPLEGNMRTNSEGKVFVEQSEEEQERIVETMGVVMEEPTGFENRTSSLITFDYVTRSMTITQSPLYKVRAKGKLFNKTVAENKVVSDTEGMWWFYFDENGVIQASQTATEATIEGNILICANYWDATNGKWFDANGFDERHGWKFPGSVHSFIHKHLHAQYTSGMVPATFVADADGSLNAHAQFSVGAGEFDDEDIKNLVASLSATTADKTVLWFDASGNVRWQHGRSFPVITTGTGRLAYNPVGSGLLEATDGNYVLCHGFALNNGKYAFFVGQNQYGSISAARAGAITEMKGLFLSVLQSFSKEFIRAFTVIYQTSDSYTNSVKARVRTNDEGGNYIDFTSASSLGGAEANNISDADANTLTSGANADALHTHSSSSKEYIAVELNNSTSAQKTYTISSTPETMDLYLVGKSSGFSLAGNVITFPEKTANYEVILRLSGNTASSADRAVEYQLFNTNGGTISLKGGNGTAGGSANIPWSGGMGGVIVGITQAMTHSLRIVGGLGADGDINLEPKPNCNQLIIKEL